MRSMGIRDRLTARSDTEERSAEVVALHDAMRAAESGAADAMAALFARLAEAHLWVAAADPPPAERLAAQSRLSGSARLDLRVGRRDRERYIPAATTHRRLERSGFLQPGDGAVRMSFRWLASEARDGGFDALAINPGSVPFGHIGAGALASFADGVLPSPRDPERIASAPVAVLGPIVPLDPASLVPGFVDAARAAVAEVPGVAAAALAARMLGEARVLVLLVGAGSPDRVKSAEPALVERLQRLVGADDHLAVTAVAPDDPTLGTPDTIALA